MLELFSDKTCVISQFSGTWGRAGERPRARLGGPFRWGIKYCQWQHFTYSRKLLISDFSGKLHMYYVRFKTSFNR